MEVRPIPGLEHLPYAEVWFHAVDDRALRAASDAARAIGKAGLEAWTTTRTPAVAEWLESRGFEEVRRYVVSELDVAAAPVPDPIGFEVVTLADRPDLADALFALAQVAYPDQPGRSETRIDESWFDWGLRAHPPEAYFVAVDGASVLGYGYLEQKNGSWSTGFLAVAPEARGRGVAGAIKRAEVAWAKEHGLASIRTANEVRLRSLLDLNARLGFAPLYDELVLRGPAA
jgi:GNAT superfamily N-acetyltransferase